MSNRIVFFAGYSSSKWNANTQLPGGSEVAVANISKNLALRGNDVWVAGDVIEADIDGVKFRSYNSFVDEFKNRPDYFDFIVGVNYIHFEQYAEESNQLRAHTVFYLHNTEYFPYYRGELIENHLEQFKNIKTILCVSHWQAEYLMNNLLDGDCEGNELVVINNGINHREFTYDVQKDPNKFIWSSAIDRGLDSLLDNWHKVREFMPEATLDIYYPKYSDPRGNWSETVGPRILEKIEKVKHLGVNDIGTVSQDKLHLAMCKASYWMYLTDYEETFCITALEMSEAGVLKITTDTAALAERNKNGICIPRKNHENIETIYDEAIKLMKVAPSSLNEKAIEAAKIENKIYTWDATSQFFHELAKKVKYGH